MVAILVRNISHDGDDDDGDDDDDDDDVDGVGDAADNEFLLWIGSAGLLTVTGTIARMNSNQHGYVLDCCVIPRILRFTIKTSDPTCKWTSSILRQTPCPLHSLLSDSFLHKYFMFE